MAPPRLFLWTHSKICVILKALNEAAINSWIPCTQIHQAFYCLRPGTVSTALQEVRPKFACDVIRFLPAGGARVWENSTKKNPKQRDPNSPVNSCSLWSHSERISGLADHSHMTVSRNCGGSHTVNWAGQRRQSAKPYVHTELDLMVQV